MLKQIFDKYIRYLLILVVIGILLNIFILGAFSYSIKIGKITEFNKYIFSMEMLKGTLSSKGVAHEVFKGLTTAFWIIYLTVIVVFFLKRKTGNDYDGIEHGSSDWAKYGEQYKGGNVSRDSGFILAEHNYLPLTRQGNLNVLIARWFWCW